MSTTTWTPLICKCGHKGNLVCTENDAPFSGMYEDYSLRGFKGEDVTITSFKDRPSDILLAMKPICPRCNSNDIAGDKSDKA